ncbi:MAG: hypothetical protein DMG70_01250 [Acidobacteria bacterium]|nr:MAG: hypothetical protein DMG70_01250 [Acidobacteriota bacterium]PYY10471.1 MAG: hypothetical protein DMG69_06530 [Acidobacteriota bacterium]
MGGARRNRFALLLAPGRANPDGFPYSEGAMGQCPSAPLNCLLHVHAQATNRAGSGGLANDHRNILQAVRLLAMAIMKRIDRRS